MTSRDLVKATLEFENKNGRVPRDLWTLPWTKRHAGEQLKRIQQEFPVDIAKAPLFLKRPTIARGEQYMIGTYVDEWGCSYLNIQDGVMGQIKEPLVKDEDWDDWEENVHIPVELLDLDVDAINAFCRNTDKFVLSGYSPNPFERMQFVRGCEELYMDLVDLPPNMLRFMDKIYEFYCELVERWAKTDVDGLELVDDWGSQNALLVSPNVWNKYFKRFYKEFIDIAHRNGKKAFMHSDGNILLLFPSLIELGLDAINTQIFSIGLENLEQYKGQITFWGEIDRQHTLVDGSVQDVEKAVRDVRECLWDDGGCIALCQYGLMAKAENVYTVYKTWDTF